MRAGIYGLPFFSSALRRLASPEALPARDAISFRSAAVMLFKRAFPPFLPNLERYFAKTDFAMP